MPISLKGREKNLSTSQSFVCSLVVTMKMIFQDSCFLLFCEFNLRIIEIEVAQVLNYASNYMKKSEEEMIV